MLASVTLDPNDANSSAESAQAPVLLNDKVFEALQFKARSFCTLASNTPGAAPPDVETTPPLRSFLVFELRLFEDSRFEFRGFRLMDDLNEPCKERDQNTFTISQFVRTKPIQIDTHHKILDSFFFYAHIF